MPDLPIGWVLAGASLIVIAIVGRVGKSIWDFVDEARLKLVGHDRAIAELQEKTGAQGQENKDQWQRIDGVSDNHGNRITRLEVEMQMLKHMTDRK